MYAVGMIAIVHWHFLCLLQY